MLIDFGVAWFTFQKNEHKKADVRVHLGLHSKVATVPSMEVAMEIIGGGMAAPSKSAVGPVWLGRRLE